MFTDKDSKYRGKNSTVTAMEKATDKSLSKAEQILSGIINDLSSYPEFDEDAIISERKQCSITPIQSWTFWKAT